MTDLPWFLVQLFVVTTCEPKQLVIKNGNVSITDDQYRAGATLVFECNEGYEIHGPETITCLDRGMWSARRFPYCIGECLVDVCECWFCYLQETYQWDKLLVKFSAPFSSFFFQKGGSSSFTFIGFENKNRWKYCFKTLNSMGCLT